MLYMIFNGIMIYFLNGIFIYFIISFQQNSVQIIYTSYIFFYEHLLAAMVFDLKLPLLQPFVCLLQIHKIESISVTLTVFVVVVFGFLGASRRLQTA